MAAFIAKQMMGDQLSAVKGQVGGEGETSTEDGGAEAEAEAERLEALREAEDARKEKHRKMEEEREGMRQGIRDRYGIKKKEELIPVAEPEMDMGPAGLNRRKKTPEEIAAENEAAEQDDLTKLKNTIETQVGELKTTMEGKCSLQ